MMTSTVNLSDLDGSNGFVLNGIDGGDRSGYSVSSAGDVNGDNIDDIIIGARLADSNGNSNAGESYVVFGSSGGFASTLELSALDGSNGFVLNGINTDDFSGRSVSSAGDVNGDGFDDVIIGAPDANPNGNRSGESYVVFGRSGGFSSSLELSSLDGSNGFVLNGIDEFDFSGFSVSSAGDVNGDGFDDVIIGAYAADSNGNFPGESYVVFGSSDGFASSLELSNLNGSNGFVLNGIDTFDNSGVSVSSAGDVNGDGFDDVIIGARDADPNGNYSGESYVVFGSSSGFASSLDLSNLDGRNGFVLNGIDAFDNSGISVNSAGDVNGDGFDDIIIGAFRADPNGDGSGESYVVFGSSSGFASTLELSSLDGSNGFVLNGINTDDFSGRSVSSAGDVNGDGFDDIIIGAFRADPNGDGSGESYVVFGSSDGFAPSLELSALDGSNGFVLNGINADDYSGASVSSAGDVNGDGFDDVIIGARFADPNGNGSAGESYVVFGGNAAPTGDITDQSTFAYDPFILNLNPIITDPNGDSLTFSATLAGGEPLPSWLSFDEATATFKGLPISRDEGTLSITVTADDGTRTFFSTLTDSFELTVELPLNPTNTTISGDSTNNTLRGRNPNELIQGRGGNDTIQGKRGNDNLFGNGGNDTLQGNRGNDYIDGGSGIDLLQGGKGKDTLVGSGGVDDLRGNNGDDLLDGGSGLDTLSGGNGNDQFVLAIGQGRDTITDFTDGQDSFLLSSSLSFESLRISETPAGDTIIRATGNGQLAILEGVGSSLIDENDFVTI